MLDVGLWLPAWEQSNVHYAVQPFTLGTAYAEPHSIELAIVFWVKIASDERVTASPLVYRIVPGKDEHTRVWRSRLDEHDLHIRTFATRSCPAGRPLLIIRQGKPTGAQAPARADSDGS